FLLPDARQSQRPFLRSWAWQTTTEAAALVETSRSPWKPLESRSENGRPNQRSCRKFQLGPATARRTRPGPMFPRLESWGAHRRHPVPVSLCLDQEEIFSLLSLSA